MKLILPILKTRQVSIYLVALVLCCASVAFANVGFGIQLNSMRSPQYVVWGILVLFVIAIAGAILLRPRFWEWEREPNSRAKIVAGCFAAVACLAPVLVVACQHLYLIGTVPASSRVDFDPGPLYSNAMVIGGLTLLLAAFIGPALGSVITFVGYLGLLVVRSWLADVAFIPIYDDRGQSHFPQATVIVLLAIAAHAWFRGSTAWAWRLFQREH